MIVWGSVQKVQQKRVVMVGGEQHPTKTNYDQETKQAEQSGLRFAIRERTNLTPTDNHHLTDLFAELDAYI